MKKSIIRVATDVGGTFTDLVCFKTDGETGKHSIVTAKTDTTPPDFETGVLNVLEKGEYRRKAAELGIVIICPDTSPRGEDVPDEKDNWQFGSGAGFYLDATEIPYSKNYNMYSYVTIELPKLIEANFDFDMSRQSIFGHSMGGHGALIMALRNPKKYKSCSKGGGNRSFGRSSTLARCCSIKSGEV